MEIVIEWGDRQLPVLITPELESFFIAFTLKHGVTKENRVQIYTSLVMQRELEAHPLLLKKIDHTAELGSKQAAYKIAYAYVRWLELQ